MLFRPSICNQFSLRVRLGRPGTPTGGAGRFQYMNLRYLLTLTFASSQQQGVQLWDLLGHTVQAGGVIVSTLC
jgi:hypothetical protein